LIDAVVALTGKSNQPSFVRMRCVFGRVFACLGVMPVVTRVLARRLRTANSVSR